MEETKNIAFLGTGLMGFPMAQNILKSGYKVTVWNRSPAKADPLLDFGAKIAATPTEATEGAEVICTMLSDGAAVQEILESDKLKASLAENSIWIDMSSTKPADARTQALILKSLGVEHLDAPVSGGTAGAESASLAIMVGGHVAAFKTASPVLSAMGRPVYVGPSGAGQLAKLANQAIVGVTIGAVAEAMLMLEAGGADPASVRDALRGGFADGTILQQHGARMTDRNFTPGGSSKLQLKDLNNVLSEAEDLGLTLPVTEHIRDRFMYFVDKMQGENLDHSGLYLELKAQNGLSE